MKPDQIIADLQRANADLQRELAEAKAERDEALEQQTATAEVLQVINSSPGDLAPVFDAMLEKAIRLCGAAFGVLNTFDGERFHLGSNRYLPAAYADFRAHNPPAPNVEPGTLHRRILEGERVVHIVDLTGCGKTQKTEADSRVHSVNTRHDCRDCSIETPPARSSPRP